jgi:hypothetical protein
MARDVGTLTVRIDARLDDLDKGLDKAEKAVKRTEKKINDTKMNPFGGIVGAAAKAVAAMGAVELVLGSVDVVTKLIKGDTEGMLEVMRRLPAGIGPVVTVMESLLLTVTGIGDQVERINKQNMRAIRELAKSQKQLSTARSFQSRAAGISESENVAGIQNALQRGIADIRLKASREIEVARQQMEAAGGGRPLLMEFKGLKGAIEKRSDRLIEELRKQFPSLTEQLKKLGPSIDKGIAKTMAEMRTRINQDPAFDSILGMIKDQRRAGMNRSMVPAGGIPDRAGPGGFLQVALSRLAGSGAGGGMNPELTEAKKTNTLLEGLPVKIATAVVGGYQ